MERTVLGCCNLEGDTATGNPVSLRLRPFNGNHVLLFDIGCHCLCSGGAPLCFDEFAVFHNLFLWIFLWWMNSQMSCMSMTSKISFRCEWVSFYDMGWNRKHPFASRRVRNALRGQNTWTSLQGISCQESACHSFEGGRTKKGKASE